MKTRCPCCGATLSLDALVAHESARTALADCFRIGGEFGGAVCRYLGLFRPKQRELSMERVARLLAEVVEDMSAGRIMRNGQVHDAPPEAWVWAVNQAISARDAGRLKTPLNGHGYLYEVIASWRPDPTALAPLPALPATPGKTSYARAAIEVLRERAK
ncbi:MAG: hypothetical protein FWH56_10720 [Betaproteobacteria bacterium]|nr:hypothetical protein [Betaproteobacteria bacterium]